MRRFFVLLGLIALALVSVACTASQKTWHNVDPDLLDDLIETSGEWNVIRDKERNVQHIHVDCIPGPDISLRELGKLDSSVREPVGDLNCRSLVLTPSDQLRIYAPYRQPILIQISDLHLWSSGEKEEFEAFLNGPLTAMQVQGEPLSGSGSRIGSFALGGLVSLGSVVGVVAMIELL